MAKKLKKSVLKSMPYLNDYVQRDEGVAPQVTTKQLKESVYETMPYLKKYAQPTASNDDIGPVKRTWFQKGAFEDGYQFGDLLKTISGTTRDAFTDVGVGIFNLVENTIDAGATLLSNVPAWEDELSAFVAKDIIDEKKLASIAALGSSLSMPNPTLIDPIIRIIEGEDWRDVLLDDSYEGDSLLGDKSDSLAQSGGQLLAQFGLQAVGVPWWVTSGVSSYGSQAEQAFQEGATAGEANWSALISAGAELLSEKIFGGFKFQGKALSDGLSDMISRGVSNKLLKSVMKFGLDAGGESIEEVFSAVASRFGQWLTYQDDKTIGEMLASEEAFDEYLESAIGGGLLGGGNTALNITQNAMAGKDPVSGLSSAEEQVVRDLFDSRVAESEKGGKKLSEFDKNKLWDEVIEQMDRGEIDIGDIVRILGGDTYKTYQDTVSKEDAIGKEFEALSIKENPTLADMKRYDVLEKQVEDIKNSTTRADLAKQLQSEVFSVAKDSRLAESYNERVRRGQAFEADVSKYSESERKVIQDAIDSGILNNTRKTHEFVDWVAKVAGAKGLEFKFTNNENLRGTQFEVVGEDGNVRLPNGYRQGNTIGINTNSKKSVNVVAGHEITHVLEGTPLYQALQDAVFRYAVAKDGQAKFDQRLKAVEDLYKGVSTDAKGELTADLVGEYLFTDKDFIKRLTTENKSLAKKVFDEIKHMWKWATAGSREKRELERVKKAFEKAYREVKADSKKTEGDVKFSIIGENANLSAEDKANLQLAKEMKESGKSNDEIYKETGWYTQSDGKWRTEILDEIMVPDNFSRTGLQSAKDSEADSILERAKRRFDNGDIPEDFYEDLVSYSEERRNAVYNSGYLPLFLHAPNLYEAYPKLRKTTLWFRNLSGMEGYTDSGYNKIVLDPDGLHKAGQTVREGLSHEIQHIIQSIEGFVSGSTPEAAGSYEAYRNTGGEIEARDVESRLRMTAEERMSYLPTHFSLSSDSDYLDAVNRGDMESAQKMVDDVAKYSGYDIEAYHGTDSDFYVFSLARRGLHGEKLGVGYYFTNNKDSAEMYSSRTGKVKHVFLDIKKPISHEIMTISENEWGNFIDYAIKHRDEYISSAWKGNSINKDFEIRDMLYFDNDADLVKTFIDVVAGRNSTVAEGYLKMLKDSIGYDGVKYENDDAKVYVAFTPEQIKSADPVVYDDSGNVIPLSERFNSENPDIRYSLSGDAEAPITQGNYHVSGKDISIDTPFNVDDIAPVAEKTTINSDKSRSTAPKSEKHIPVEKAAEKHFMDSKLSFDKIAPEVREKVAGRWKDIQKSTKDALSFVKYGADGVRPLHDIFADANNDGLGGVFEDYLHHCLNVDRMTLNSRFGLKDKPVFGENVRAADSQQRIAEIERDHPEFVELAKEVYAYNTYLRDLLVKGGVISQKVANRWTEMYPHYVPIWRIGFGDENHISDLFNFVANQDTSSLEIEEVDSFFGEVQHEAPLKEATGGEQDFKTAEDTMSDRALQTFWTLAMRGVDTTVSSDVASDATMDQETDVQSEEELARYKPTPRKERSNILKEGRNNFVKSFQEHILDSGYVFEKVSKKTRNRNLEAKWNFRRNAGSMAQRLIDNGDAKHGVPSLKKMHKALKKAGTLDAFSDYLGYKAHVDGMTLQSRYVLANNRSFMGYDVSVFDAQDRIAKLEAEHPEFKSLAEGVYRYTNFLTDQLVDKGVISESDANLWREILPHYVPMKSSASKGRVLDALGRFTNHVYKLINSNSFSGELFKTLNSQDGRELIDIDSFMTRLESGVNDVLALTQNNGRYQYTVYENGERVTYEINEEMYEALKPRHVALQKRIPVLSFVNSCFRGLTTQYNPVFALTNPIKDLQDVLLNSQHPGKTYANILRAVGEMFTKGKYFQEYLANGGDTNSYFNTRKGPFAEENVAKKFLDKVFFLNEYIEMAPRLAEYIASRESGRNVETSMLDAARVTTNFAAGGDVTKFFNRNGCTFLNASIQGAIQQVRNVQEAHQKGAMGYVGLVTRCAIGGLLPVLLNNMMWDDDEDYEKLADYVKEGYYIFGKTEDGKFFRIPKGRALSVLQETIDMVMDYASGDDEVDLARFLALGTLALENIAPNNPIENNIFAPVMETFYNRTWYGEELVPERLENLPYAEQYDEKIDVASRALAQTRLGKALNWSPYKINYLLNAYGGGLADILLPMWTPRSESGDDSFLGKLTAPVRDKFVTDSVLNSQTVTDFYDVCDELERNANSMYATETDRFKYMYIESVCFDTNELYAEKRVIQNSDMAESEKYHRVREIQDQINEMMEEALNSYQNPQIDGLYAEVGSKRFNYDEESGNWYPIRETNADGSPNWYYEMEQKVTQGLDISYGEYWNNREEYNFAYEKPGQYALSQAVGGYEDYQTYHSALWDIKADKDEYGQSINGTRKKKVVEYINGLDCEYGMKILLYKSEYPNDDKYNYDIIEYLNEREDISYEQMETILKELGFKVDSKGRITW